MHWISIIPSHLLTSHAFIYFLLFSSISCIYAQNTTNFTCDFDYACADLQCANNANCTVKCTAKNSCRNTDIFGPKHGTLVVSCIGQNSCRSTTITSYNDDLSVECIGQTSCYNSDLNCPQHGLCDIDCTFMTPNACTYIDVRGHALSGKSSTLSFRSMSGSTKQSIHCPGNNRTCDIYCGPSGCVSAVMFTNSDTGRLNIIAEGSNALKSSIVYCPTAAGHKCIITANGDNTAKDILTDILIHSRRAFDDLSLLCNISNTSNCYDPSFPPLITCTSNYRTCNLGLKSGNDNWNCAQNNITTICSDSTPPGYYGSYFVCTSQLGIYCRDIFCNNDTDCAVKCTAVQGCYGTTIIAPSNADLVVECSGEASCDGSGTIGSSYIVGASAGSTSIEVICSTTDSCRRLTVTANAANLSVICSGAASTSCRQAKFYCPTSGLCDIDCTTSQCNKILVDGTHMISGSLLFQSTALTSQGTILCPGNDIECRVRCGDSGCTSFTFDAQLDGALLDITASGTSSLESSAIYCPYVGNCSIHALEGSLNALSDVNIYAVNGLQDVVLYCNYSSNSSSCYGVFRPQLYCIPDFSVFCNISLQSGYDGWECDSAISAEICQFTLYPTIDPTYDPTIDPTVYPTVTTMDPGLDPTADPTINPTTEPTIEPTTEPTNDPTFDPSLGPTADPTDDPTNDPTNDPIYDPTHDPTNDPTFDPTNNPTIDPTYDPTINPSNDPTSDPTTDPTLDPIIDTTSTDFIFDLNVNWSISIEFNECQSDTKTNDECIVDTDKVTEQILIAFADQNVNILSADIIDNSVIIKLSISVNDYNTLDKEYIGKEIERELEDEYGDIDVTIEETDNRDKHRKKQNITHLILYVSGGCLVIIAVVVTIYVRVFIKKKKRVQEEANMMSMEIVKTTQSNNLGMDTIQTDDVVVHKTTGENDDVMMEDDEGTADECTHSDASDSLYNQQTPVITAGNDDDCANTMTVEGATAGTTIDDGDDDDDDDESLYDTPPPIVTPENNETDANPRTVEGGGSAGTAKAISE